MEGSTLARFPQYLTLVEQDARHFCQPELSGYGAANIGGIHHDR